MQGKLQKIVVHIPDSLKLAADRAWKVSRDEPSFSMMSSSMSNWLKSAVMAIQADLRILLLPVIERSQDGKLQKIVVNIPDSLKLVAVRA